MGKHVFITAITVALFLNITGCRNTAAPKMEEEDLVAKKSLQGIWIDEDTKEPSLRINGDTIFYADSTSVPALFKIVNDSLIIKDNSGRANYYKITKLYEHVLYFKNNNGDEIHLVRSENPKDDTFKFETSTNARSINQGKLIKRDTVVSVNNLRYHCYIQINPTTYKVYRTTYDDNGIEVSNIYYDNIINVNIYNGAKKIFSKDFKKEMFKGKIPTDFLQQSILTDIELSKTSTTEGFIFKAIFILPDELTEYQSEIHISANGSMKIVNPGK